VVAAGGYALVLERPTSDGAPSPWDGLRRAAVDGRTPWVAHRETAKALVAAIAFARAQAADWQLYPLQTIARQRGEVLT
jgi:hypothetical protein